MHFINKNKYDIVILVYMSDIYNFNVKCSDALDIQQTSMVGKQSDSPSTSTHFFFINAVTQNMNLEFLNKLTQRLFF